MSDLTTMWLERRGRVAEVTFTRPDLLNSITEAFLDDLGTVLDLVESDDRIRVLVLRGSGRAFCVGLDLEVLRRGFDDGEYFMGVLRQVHDLLFRVEELAVPVVAAVDGIARAGGFELMLACDLVVVSETAPIGDVHTGFGVMPGGGSTFRLPWKIGDQRAREMIMTARWLTGREAVDFGLAMRAVPSEQLDQAVGELTGTLVDKPRGVHGAVKRAMLASRTMSTRAAAEAELEVFRRYVIEGSEAREGFTAYLEGRPPGWA